MLRALFLTLVEAVSPHAASSNDDARDWNSLESSCDPICYGLLDHFVGDISFFHFISNTGFQVGAHNISDRSTSSRPPSTNGTSCVSPRPQPRYGSRGCSRCALFNVATESWGRWLDCLYPRPFAATIPPHE